MKDERVVEAGAVEAAVGDAQRASLRLVCAVICVQHNHTLRELSLESNGIGSAGAKALAEALQVRSPSRM